MAREEPLVSPAVGDLARVSRGEDPDRSELPLAPGQAELSPAAVAPAREQAAALRAGPPTPIQQLAQAIVASDGAQVELSLEPEELGRVRFHIQISEHGVALNVSADRPETLDMLRRHVEHLARYLSEAGFQSSSFNFSGERRGRFAVPAASFAPEEDLPVKGEQGGEVAAEARRTARSAARDGVDLRV